jgi:hypothetical protein
MASQLPSWKSQLMQKPDRLAWVKSVLGGIPLHRLLVLTLPKKTLKLMEKIERGFIWEGRVTTNDVCRPNALDGLGIQDLERT